MSTPSIQTLITQAQQVLNLKSSNEIRATLAAVLANANVGTPLNPNLTTQQLWDEFYEIVRQPSDDIMSIITDQMMRMVFSPPAPGGAGADKQVIFNDGGVLAGDTKFLWDKNANRLDVDGPVVITGDLTASSDVLVNGNEKYVYLSSTYIIGSNSRVRFRAVGGGGGSGYGGDFRISTRKSDNNWNTDALTVDSTGNVSIANGNLVMTTSGKGIDFSATANSSGTMTSELLNDYEEGTFTPTVIGTTTAGTATYSRQLGRYTKVGNLVTIQIYLAWSAGTGVGNLAFSGLPFTIANNANEYATATIGFFDSIALTALNIPTIIGPANDTKLQLWQFPVGGGAPSQVPYDAAGSIILTSTYIAA